MTRDCDGSHHAHADALVPVERPSKKEFWSAVLGNNTKLSNLAKAAITDAVAIIAKLTEEMTPEQVEEWCRNQRSVSAKEEAQIDKSLYCPMCNDYATKLAAAQKDVFKSKCMLLKIHDALCAASGDTDPPIDDEMTDEEVRESEPVFWAAKEIAGLIGDAPWDQYAAIDQAMQSDPHHCGQDAGEARK